MVTDPALLSTSPALAASPWVVRWAHLVRAGGNLLDVACGSGRHARWFASRGHAVTAVDRDADAIAARADGVVGVVADLEADPWPFGDQRFDAIVVTRYLWRPLMPTLVHALNDGGILICETFARGHETIGRPRQPAFLLERGELLSLTAGLRIVAFEDGYDAAADAQLQRVVAVREPVQGSPSMRYALAAEGVAHHG